MGKHKIITGFTVHLETGEKITHEKELTDTEYKEYRKYMDKLCDRFARAIYPTIYPKMQEYFASEKGKAEYAEYCKTHNIIE